MADTSQNNASINVYRLEKKIDDLTQQTANMGSKIDSVGNSVSQVEQELKKLAKDFEIMFNEQKRSSTLQRAMTELVRVRQELENNYGNYKVVRETMLGVLQATDLALVKKTTISRVSEELMLSTPKYWLAPCLVAVSAWIGNDRDLAERAIAEAVKRDEERTALTMALICRRNNKVNACYEWLSIYFANQDAANFSEGSFTYIDAYVNGVFGPDEKHMCDDYISKWIDEIRGNNSVFEKEQEDTWKGYCANFHKGIDTVYPDLKDTVQEYDRIDSYVGRINSVDVIAENFNRITNAYVDQEGLKAAIDKNLIELVSKYDSEEEPLRKEETFLMAVKKFDGDESKARRSIIQDARMRQRKVLNLVEQMANVITSDEKVLPSQKKTAVSFLSSYIKKGFHSYITEKKTEFPESITLNVNGWIGTTSDGSNCQQLCADYDQYLQNCFQQEITKANTTNEPKKWQMITIASAVLALVFVFLAPFMTVAFAAAAVFSFFKINKSKKDIQNNILAINQKYSDMSVQGKIKIENCIREWCDAKHSVEEFNNQPIRDIIA